MKLSAALDDLLEAHGLRGLDKVPFEHTGFSGATLMRIRRSDGALFVLKRMSIDRDWIMRATNDVHCREASLASTPVSLPDGVATPSLGAAVDDDGYALLMQDITPYFLPSGAITKSQFERIIGKMVQLHRSPIPDAAIPWCSLETRLALLTPTTARIAASYGAPVARDLTNGWDAFDRHASPAARSLIRGRFDDLGPLLRALGHLQSAFLHGDLKFDNIGLDADGRMWLIDWAMTLVAPPAVELGWFVAINSRQLPVTLDDALALYAHAAALHGTELDRHNALTAVCGLLLRGWRKALDAEAGEPEELRWWCERVEAANKLL